MLVRGPTSSPAPPAHAGGTGDFDSFYLAHFERLVLQLYAYTGDLAQAQDVVQEAFARALPRWDRVVRYDDPIGWVRRVAWNLATSRLRQLRRFRSYASSHREEHASGPSPDRVALTRALRKLPQQQRQATVLHYLADLPIGEIAAAMGVADGTVKSWLHRARKTLADILSDQRGEVRDV
jgi:RNA polymerase sigma-70 factor (ECF subfamily)